MKERRRSLVGKESSAERWKNVKKLENAARTALLLSFVYARIFGNPGPLIKLADELRELEMQHYQSASVQLTHNLAHPLSHNIGDSSNSPLYGDNNVSSDQSSPDATLKRVDALPKKGKKKRRKRSSYTIEKLPRERIVFRGKPNLSQEGSLAI
ncbi:MAG: hypothetical protein M1450_03760 [Patescibacteria group bacterium]|nr:hypothetical protein [Patescibacteria group bacterium]